MAKDGQLTSEDGRYSVSNRNPGNPVTEHGGQPASGYPVTEVTRAPDPTEHLTGEEPGEVLF